MRIEFAVYLAPSGQWSWRIMEDGVAVCGGGGCASEDQAHCDLLRALARCDEWTGPDALVAESSQTLGGAGRG